MEMFYQFPPSPFQYPHGVHPLHRSQFAAQIGHYQFSGHPSSIMMHQMSLARHMYNNSKHFDYLIVVDFEATCENSQGNDEIVKPIRTDSPEIIQFPAVLVDVKNMVIVDHFDSIVKPVLKPVLSQFCTKLTGITQEMVDDAPVFPKVLRRFEKWIKKHQLNNSVEGKRFALVTDGSYDMGHFLYKQCINSQIPFPTYAKHWVNIRTIYGKLYHKRWYNLKAVLEVMGLNFEGRPHNGLDDAKNIAKVLLRMIYDGCHVQQTEKIILDFEGQKQNEAKILNNGHGRFDLATVKAVELSHDKFLFVPHHAFRYPAYETDDSDNVQINAVEDKENVPVHTSKKCSSNDKKNKASKRKSVATTNNIHSISLKAADELESNPIADK